MPEKGPTEMTPQGGQVVKRPKVLVVEDNATNHRILCRMLGILGYDALGAVFLEWDDAFKALAAKADLALIDHQLPGSLTGLDIATELVLLGVRNKVIAVVSADGSPEHENNVLAAGFSHLPKPTTLAGLRNALGAMMTVLLEAEEADEEFEEVTGELVDSPGYEGFRGVVDLLERARIYLESLRPEDCLKDEVRVEFRALRTQLSIAAEACTGFVGVSADGSMQTTQRDLAHQIRGSFNPIIGTLELIGTMDDPAEIENELKAIRRFFPVAHKMLVIGLSETTPPRPAPLLPVLRDVVALFAHDEGITVDIRGELNVLSMQVNIHPEILTLVIGDMVNNAKAAALSRSDGYKVKPTVKILASVSPDGIVELRATDNAGPYPVGFSVEEHLAGEVGDTGNGTRTFYRRLIEMGAVPEISVDPKFASAKFQALIAEGVTNSNGGRGGGEVAEREVVGQDRPNPIVSVNEADVFGDNRDDDKGDDEDGAGDVKVGAWKQPDTMPVTRSVADLYAGGPERVQVRGGYDAERMNMQERPLTSQVQS